MSVFGIYLEIPITFQVFKCDLIILETIFLPKFGLFASDLGKYPCPATKQNVKISNLSF
jgi:hypothetical protein